MAHVILKFNNLYCEWSTIVDSPISYLMPLDAFKKHMLLEIGKRGCRDLYKQLNAADDTGSSSYAYTKDELLSTNRAGHNESHLSEAELIKAYTMLEPATIDVFQWVPIDNVRLPSEGRHLIYTPNGGSMEYRVIPADLRKTATHATHCMLLEPPK